MTSVYHLAIEKRSIDSPELEIESQFSHYER